MGLGRGLSAGARAAALLAVVFVFASPPPKLAHAHSPRPTHTHAPATHTPCPQSHRSLCEGVSALARRVQADRELTNLIRRKFAIKCTTGGFPEGVLWRGLPLHQLAGRGLELAIDITLRCEWARAPAEEAPRVRPAERAGAGRGAHHARACAPTAS